MLALLWKVLPWQLTLCFLILHGLSLRQQLVLVIGCVSIELKKHHYKSLCSHGDSLFSSSQPLDFKMLVIFSSKNIKRGHKLKLTYLYACWIMQVRYHWQISKWNVKDGKKSLGKVWNSVCCLEKKTVKWDTFCRILLHRTKHFWYKLAEISFFIIFNQNLVEQMTSSVG